MKGIICIGRQYGSGGREVGEKLARKLGIPCYDKLLIKKAALESGLSTDFISKTEESPINSIQFLSEILMRILQALAILSIQRAR